MLGNKTNREIFRINLGTNKSNTILKAYQYLSLKKQKRGQSENVKGHNYLDNYLDSKKIYAKEQRYSSKMNEQMKEKVSLRDKLKTASLGSRNHNEIQRFPIRIEENSVNLFFSEGKRRFIYDQIEEKNNQNKQFKLSRAKSAKTMFYGKQTQSMRGTPRRQ